MKNSEIQVGLPCVYEQFCYWTGVAIAVFVVGLIGAILISVWRDKIKQQRRRQQTRKQKAKKE